MFVTTDLSDRHIQHLGMIQDVIKRLADNSFSVRRWTLVTVGALIALAVRADEPILAYASLGPALVFWGLDGYYLRQERLFRRLYDRVRTSPDSVDPFAMWAPDLASPRESYRSVVFSITEFLVYFPIAIIAIVIGIVLQLR